MAARRFGSAARVALFLAAHGRCAACGAVLTGLACRPRAGAAGGETTARTGGRCARTATCQGRPGVSLLRRCARGRRRSSTACRRGRPDFPARRDARRRQDAGRLPCRPGAGAEQVIVVCPTTRCAPSGPTPPTASACTSIRAGATPTAPGTPDVDGVVVTYQQVASAPGPVRPPSRPADVRRARRDPSRRRAGHAGAPRCARRSTARAGGWRCRARRFAPTPERSRSSRYDEDRRCAPDYVYGYGDAVADGVCRPLAFRLLDATLRWRVDEQETIAAFADELDPQDDARRLRTAIDPATPLLPQMLRDADALLLQGACRRARRRRARAVRRSRSRPRRRRAAADDQRARSRSSSSATRPARTPDRAVRARRAPAGPAGWWP